MIEQAVRAVRCPHCDAMPGEPCMSRTRCRSLLGKGKRHHAERVRYSETGIPPGSAWLRWQIEDIKVRVIQKHLAERDRER